MTISALACTLPRWRIATADAARHEQIASSHARNPVAKLGRDMADHRRTLARIVESWPSSCGISRAACGYGARYWRVRRRIAGAPDPGSPLPTDDDLTRLAATATTA